MLIEELLHPNQQHQLGAEEDSYDDEYESELEPEITEVDDPLLEDKQYLVTMIVTHF